MVLECVFVCCSVRASVHACARVHVCLFVHARVCARARASVHVCCRVGPAASPIVVIGDA